jgi:hypothetical protein
MSSESEFFTNVIAKYLSQGKCPDMIFNNVAEYEPFDKYIDEQIADGSIVKHSMYSFTGVGWASKVNQHLIQSGSPYRLVAVDNNDQRLYTKVKGQAAYFILTKNGKDESSLIFTWSFNPFQLEPLR